MRFWTTILAALPLISLSLTPAREAAACGGCFHEPMENTQVASHRMVLSIAKTQSTLYDQIQYSGDPTSFAWVLPVKGTVTIGLSSDALFNQLDSLTRVTVSPPPLNCACSNGGFGSSSSASSGSSSGGGGVTVVSQQVVGPYETVQLSSQDPAALSSWLSSHGYVIPADVSPIISTYVSEGFDFLALKLVPGSGVDAMKPVRVTTPGASPVLPLRMVAAGVGAKVPVTLFMVAEGRYQPVNFPWFTIPEDQLVWDFATQSSNYKTLRQAGFDATMGRGWLLETTNAIPVQFITDNLLFAAQNYPMESGYGDDMGNGALMEAQDDMDTLLAGISPTSLWLTRIYAELPRTALAQDLTLGASPTQAAISGVLKAQGAVNVPPCPCASSSSSSGGGSGGSISSSSGGGDGGGGSSAGGGGGCAIGGADSAPVALGGLSILLSLAGIRRRRR